jgi:hypothetical protein
MSIEELLAEGLEKGFGGSTNIEKVSRGGFDLTSSHYEIDGNVYHDEWVTGGGNELAKDTDGNGIIRTYVGDVVSSDILNSLDITEKDIMSFLKTVILEHREEIRFDTDFKTERGDWLYTYKATYMRENPFIINGIEEIYYKNTSVFVHTFGISKVTL